MSLRCGSTCLNVMEPIKFSLSSVARLGSLQLGDVNLPTPATLLYTQAGSVPHLTVDNVERISQQPHPLLVPLQTTYTMRDCVAALGMGISRFCGFPERCPTLQIIQDPLTEISSGFSDRRGVSIFESSGKTLLNSESLTDVTAAFRPAAYQALTDGDTPKDCSNKRLNHSVKRSTEYLDQCLRLKEEKSLQSGLLASIQGGYNEVSRKFSVSDLFERDQEKISGYIIDGFHTNGAKTADLQFKSIATLLNSVVEALPKSKPRFMFGCFSPDMIIQLVRSGIDCFDSSYACLQTDNCRALVFSLQEVKDAVEHVQYLQLDDGDKYKGDMSVILEGCQCYTCSEGFTRAYINHLLQTKELLAFVLLQMHNLHHWLRFFQQLRADLNESS